VRSISATNADLPAMIRAGTFRQDLVLSLNVIELDLPPLARRPTTSCRSPSISWARASARRLRGPRAAAACVAGQRARAEERDAARVAARQGPAITAATWACRRAATEAEPPSTGRRSRKRSRARGGVVAQAAAELGLAARPCTAAWSAWDQSRIVGMPTRRAIRFTIAARLRCWRCSPWRERPPGRAALELMPERPVARGAIAAAIMAPIAVFAAARSCGRCSPCCARWAAR
jgi:hypothetical protein